MSQFKQSCTFPRESHLTSVYKSNVVWKLSISSKDFNSLEFTELALIQLTTTHIYRRNWIFWAYYSGQYTTQQNTEYSATTGQGDGEVWYVQGSGGVTSSNPVSYTHLLFTKCLFNKQNRCLGEARQSGILDDQTVNKWHQSTAATLGYNRGKLVWVRSWTGLLCKTKKKAISQLPANSTDVFC